MKYSLFVYPAVLALCLSACSYSLEGLGLAKKSDDKPVTAPTGGAGKVSGAGDKLITFDTVKDFSLRTCLECHEDFKKPEQVLSERGEILHEISTGDMPPKKKGYQPLTPCEHNILEAWIEDQLNSRPATKKVSDIAGCGGEVQQPLPLPDVIVEVPKKEEKKSLRDLEATFENVKKEILEPKCLKCHSVDTARETVLEDVASIRGNTEVLLDADAEKSLLYTVCLPKPDTGLPRMPTKKSGIAPLTGDELDLLKRWIEIEGKK